MLPAHPLRLRMPEQRISAMQDPSIRRRRSTPFSVGSPIAFSLWLRLSVWLRSPPTPFAMASNGFNSSFVVDSLGFAVMLAVLAVRKRLPS